MPLQPAELLAVETVRRQRDVLDDSLPGLVLGAAEDDVVRLDGLALAQQDGALDQVVQLAHVARTPPGASGIETQL